MSLITKLGNGGIFWIITAVVLLFFKKTRKTGVTMAIALILGLLLGNIFLKNVIARPRPFVVNPLIELIIEKPGEFSFPSGHTLSSFECAIAIFIKNKKWGIAAIVLAAIIALSRLYLYVHYPTDIIAGILLGIAIAFLATFIANKIYDKIKAK